MSSADPTLSSILPALGAALALLAWRPAFLRGPAPAALPATHAGGHGFVLAFLALFAVSAAHVLYLAWDTPIFHTEPQTFMRALMRDVLASEHHAPLHAWLLSGWFEVMETLGVPPEMVWIRLPNLLPLGCVLWLLLRLGQHAGAPWAGIAAAAWWGLLPATAVLTITQENYLLEMTAGLWFVERTVANLFTPARSHRSLAVSAALALWSGYMNVLVVGPGALLLVAVALRRREYKALAYALLLALVLLAPLLPQLPAILTGYPERYAQFHGQERGIGAGGFWAVWTSAASELYGCALLFLGATAWALLRGPALPAVLLVIIATFAAASTQVFLNFVNLNPILPLVLFVTALGLDRLLRDACARLRAPAWSAAPMLGAAVLGVALLEHLALSERPSVGAGSPARARWPHRTWETLVAESPPAMPILAFPDFEPMFALWYACTDQPSVRLRYECASAWPAEELPGMRFGARGGRESAALVRLDDAFRSLPALLGRPAWAGGFLLVGRGGSHEYGGMASASDTGIRNLLASRCRPVSEGRISISRCR